MHSKRTPWRFRVLAMTVSTVALLGARLAAADARTTEMAPFHVEAEFGVDGLRIQPSTSVLNPYLLDQYGVAQLQDISAIAPNLFTSNSDTRGFGDIIALRGLANSIFFSSPAVALYVDDVPGGSVSSYPSALLNLESFTVKAGPQGTDYGRTAAGGVIDIKTQAPGSVHRGSVLLDYGSFKASSARASFDGPVNNQLGYSLGFGLSDREGYLHNSFLKRSADDRSALNGRGALYWKPGSDLQLRFGVVGEKIRDDATRLSSLFSPDRFSVASDLNGQTRIDRLQFSFQAKRKMAWATLVATTSWQDFELAPSVTDLDLSPLALASSRVNQEEKLWTQEIRLESAPLADKSSWRAGVFYSDSDVASNALREFVVPPGTFVPPGFIQSERTIFNIGQKNLAAYGNYDRPLTRQLTLKLGVRAEHTDGDIDRTKAASNNFRFPSPQDAVLKASQQHDYVSGSAGLTFAASDALSLTARTATAERPHGYSGFTASPTLARFRNESQWSNELGVTFGPPKGRVAGSVLGFWNKINDYQFERTVPGSTDFVVVNADEVRSRGLEAKLMWSPVDRVWWDLQAGYTDATFKQHRDATGASVNGKHVPFIPRYTFRSGVTVDLIRGLSANASYVAVGRTFYDERNTTMFSQKAYGIVNAQLRYRCDQWTATLYAQNLFQKDYYQFINPEIFAGSPGAPRRVGVQLSFAY